MELELQPLHLPSDNERPRVIAGPCSVESEEQMETVARAVKASGAGLLRGGVPSIKREAIQPGANLLIKTPWQPEIPRAIDRQGDL